MNRKKIFIILATIIIIAGAILLIVIKNNKKGYKAEYNIEKIFSNKSTLIPVIKKKEKKVEVKVKTEEKVDEKINIEEKKETKKSINRKVETKTAKNISSNNGADYYCEVDKIVYEDTIVVKLHIYDKDGNEANENIKAVMYNGARRTSNKYYANNDEIVFYRQSNLSNSRRFVVNGKSQCYVYFTEDDHIKKNIEQSETIVEENNNAENNIDDVNE